MSETRKIAAIVVADVVGYSRLAAADEDRTLARLRGLRSDLIDPAIALHYGRIVKRTGDGIIIEFRSVVDAARCAVEVQTGMVERNAGLPPERRIEFRVGVHLGDVVEESDGDLMGNGVNIAARIEGIAAPGEICLSEDAYRQVKGRLDLAVRDLGPTQLKNIAEPIRVYSLDVGMPAVAKPAPTPVPEKSAPPRLSMVVLPFANIGGDPDQEHFVDGVTESLTTDLSRIRGARVVARNTAFTFKGKPLDVKTVGRELNDGVDGAPNGISVPRWSLSKPHLKGSRPWASLFGICRLSRGLVSIWRRGCFRVHAVDAKGEIVVARKLTRSQLIPFFAELPPCVVAMEACSSGHHWGRALIELGHEVRLIPPAHVKPYVRRNKSDQVDAAGDLRGDESSWPEVRAVVRSIDNQAELNAPSGARAVARRGPAHGGAQCFALAIWPRSALSRRRARSMPMA